MSNYTPGPWAIEPKCGCIVAKVKRQTWTVATAHGGPSLNKTANALLIVAAPDLRSSLEAMLKRLDCPCHTEDEWCEKCGDVFRNARRVIAASEGGHQ